MIPRPFITTPEIQDLYGASGVPYLNSATMVAESAMRVETVEWSSGDRTPIRPRLQDPGAGVMIMQVRDLDAIMARVAGLPASSPAHLPGLSKAGISRIISHWRRITEDLAWLGMEEECRRRAMRKDAAIAAMGRLRDLGRAVASCPVASPQIAGFPCWAAWTTMARSLDKPVA